MNNIKPLYLFLLIGVLLGLLFASGQVENPDTHLRLTQTRLFLDNFKLGLPNDVGEELHGNIAINKSGDRYMVYNPGQSILFIPIYCFAKLVSKSQGECYYRAAFLVSFINFIIHALCAFVLFNIAQSLGASKSKSYFLSFVFCFTSYSFSFAQSTYEHHFEMLFILIAFNISLSRKIKNYGLFVGISITIGLFFRSTAILAFPTLLFLANENKQRILLLLGLIPGIIFIFFYNYTRFGNPFESGYNIAWRIANGTNFSFWSLNRIPYSLFSFFLSPAKGLFFFSPSILISLWGVKKFWIKHRNISLSIIAISSSYLFLFSMNFAWHGSIWSFGPRYILPILPFLYLPISEVNFKKWCVPLLFLATFGQVLIISVNYKRAILEKYLSGNGIDEQKYISNIANTPYLVQFKQLLVIIPKNFSGVLQDHFPNTPWRKETRLASARDVLNYSIENNSINFWWVRIFNWKTSLLERIATTVIFLFSLVMSIILFRYAKAIK